MVSWQSVFCTIASPLCLEARYARLEPSPRRNNYEKYGMIKLSQWRQEIAGGALSQWPDRVQNPYSLAVHVGEPLLGSPVYWNSSSRNIAGVFLDFRYSLQTSARKIPCSRKIMSSIHFTLQAKIRQYNSTISTKQSLTNGLVQSLHAN